MKKGFTFLPVLFLLALPVKADFGDADFPVELLMGGPKSYHDAWCGRLNNECRVRFQGPMMWVEGQGGIKSSQYIEHTYSKECKGDLFRNCGAHFHYITYKSDQGPNIRQALFLFSSGRAQAEFSKALRRWKSQSENVFPNYRLPASQGPQDTQGRDKGLNPYDYPPITDWSEKTTD
ncbi:hypothetical protein [Prochlorococcus marinus]|uniref:hypothetical protein n=1 Tax=Prochlorococcus marinus TaxID=1219 RepID=UPI0022B46EEA|nr:hypothetical protein [Prochlorococcus marinus]